MSLARVELTEPVTFRRVFEQAVARNGSTEALVTDAGRITYAALGADVRRAADRMAAAGVGRGHHVGLLLGNSIEWATLCYAAASIGAITVPLNTRFRADELRFCLNQARVETLFFARRFLKADFLDLIQKIEPAVATGLPGSVLPHLRRAVMLGDEAAPAGVTPFRTFMEGTPDARRYDAAGHGEEHRESASPDDTLLIQYTSGTTAFPKGVMLSHRNMLQMAAAVSARIGVRPDDRYFSIRPFAHVGGSTMTLFVSLVSGATVVTLPAFDLPKTLRMLEEERCTLVSGNDTIFQMLLAHPQLDPAKLHLRGGWAAVDPEVMRQIHEVLGARAMVNAYGLSEASPNVVMQDSRDPPESRLEAWAAPHDGLEVRIADPETGTIRGPREPGEIQVRGWSLMKGYYDMPEETAKAIGPDGWLRSGDLGEMDERGRIRMIGRLKDVFRVGGENVSPAEVEATILEHPAVGVAQVVGVPDARLVEVAAAYVQPKAGAALTEKEIVDWCASRCANFKVPRYVRIVASFDWAQVTASGKIQKGPLREQALQDFGLAEAGARQR